MVVGIGGAGASTIDGAVGGKRAVDPKRGACLAACAPLSAWAPRWTRSASAWWCDPKKEAGTVYTVWGVDDWPWVMRQMREHGHASQGK